MSGRARPASVGRNPRAFLRQPGRNAPMSRDDLDPGSRPPRRPRPPQDPGRRPPPLPPESSAFRPNPAGAPAAGPAKPKKSKSDRSRDRDPLGAKPLILAEGPKWWERILFGRVG